MDKLIPSSKKNPCPVCSGTNAACKSREAFVLCMSEADAAKFEIVGGWKKIDTADEWGVFVPANQQGRDPIEAKKQSQAKRDREALLKSGLNADERHTAHTQLLAQLPLHDADRADLERRGLPAATIESFCSIEPGQQLGTPINPKTPGVGFGGKKLLTRARGYLVPALDLFGRAAAFQIRNRENDGPKYPWLSVASVTPANLCNSEMPLTFAHGDVGGSSLYLAEGLLKPLIAAERLGINVIGASGGLFASSPQQLTEWLGTLRFSDLILCPDAGAIANAHTMRQYVALNDLLTGLGHELKVLWYGQRAKAAGDIDEISREQFEQAKLITWAEFQAKNVSQPIAIAQAEEKPCVKPASNPVAAVKALDAKPAAKAKPQQQSGKIQTRAEWKEQQKVEKHRRAYEKIGAILDIDVDIDMDDPDYKAVARNAFCEPLKSHLKYETHGELTEGFAEELHPNEEGRSLIAYDISQGGGKSNNCLIPAALRTVSGGGRVLIVVPSRGLAKEFKSRLNRRAGENIANTHMDSECYKASIVVCCPESVYKFKGQKFDLIQIDESNEIFHRIESAELGRAGLQSLAAFRQLLASTQRVAIATAAMSGRTLAAAQTIGGFTPNETQLQRRSRPATEMKIFEYFDLYQWLQKIIETLRSGQRVAIPTGSQGKGRMIDRILRQLFPNKSGLVIDGAATMQNLRSEFLKDPDAMLERLRPDWFIFTPVINSGVSIEGGHFDIQFEYATPHEGAQSISQRGERVRSAIGRDGAIAERHIYFSQQGAPSLEAYPGALDWQYWAEELADEANAPMGAAAALAKALGAEKALDPIKQDAEKFAGMRPNLPHFMSLRAFEIIYKRELLHEDWARFGWSVSEVEKPNGEEKEQLAFLKEFCDKVRIGIVQQEGRTLKKVKTREAEGELDEISNPFQAMRARKAYLEKLLGKDYLSEQNAEFYAAWFADNSGSNPGARAVVRSQLLQIAINEPEAWKQIEHAKTLKFLAGKPDPESDLHWHLPELPAASRDIELVSIVARCPGIADVVAGKTQKWTNQDPQVVAAGLYLVAHGKQIAANTKHSGLIRGAKFSEQMAPAGLLNKALEMVGHKAHKEARQGTGNRLNVYRLEAEADVRAKLETLLGEGEDGLKLFRAEQEVIRAKTRESINEAAKSCITSKAQAWQSEAMRGQIEAAIAGIQARHPDSLSHGFTDLGDATEKPVIEQRELVLTAQRPTLPEPKIDFFTTQDHDPLANNFYDSSAWG